MLEAFFDMGYNVGRHIFFLFKADSVYIHEGPMFRPGYPMKKRLQDLYGGPGRLDAYGREIYLLLTLSTI